MKKKDLADVCHYLKGTVIPHTPDDFIIGEPFRHGLTDDEIKEGISAFRSFLYKLYDALAASKDAFDIKTGSKYDPDNGVDSIHKHFPIISDLAVILFSFGIQGRLETEPRRELVLSGDDLLIPLPPKSEKYYSISKMTGKRKLEVFNFLSDMGFYFEDTNFSEEVDFIKTGTFYVRYEENNFLPVGLKLIAEAQKNIKSDYYKFTTAFMRGDFYPLANTVPKSHVVNIHEFVGSQGSEIRDWILSMDKLLTDGGCKTIGDIGNFAANGSFAYISRKDKRTICKIDLRISGCEVRPQGNHLANPDNILIELPEIMLDSMKSGKVCGICAENDPNFIHCKHGGPFKFTHDGVYYERCRFDGFRFALNGAAEREVLKKWIELELVV